MKNIKKVFGGILGLFGVIGVAFAVWLALTQSTYTATVEGQPDNPVSFTTVFDDVVLHCANTSDSQNSTAYLNNANGELQMVVDYIINKTDVIDECIDYENDCDVQVYFRPNGDLIYTPVSDGGIITMPPGVSAFISTVSCERLSCPQSIETGVSVTKV